MRYLIFILLILTNSYSYAQIDMSNFCNFNEYDGLSNASIIDITQDNKGLIWFGTRNGLNKFDGYTFYNYLENKNIQDLMIDGNNLWIALKPYMLCHFNLITEKINYYKPTNYEKGAITSILKHNDSLLWLGTSKGLLLFNSFTREFTQLPENTFSKPDRLKDIIIQTLYKDSKNRIWIGTYGNGLYKIKTQNNKITYQRYFNTKKIFDIEEDDSGNLFLCAYDYGLIVYNPDDDKIIKTYKEGNKQTQLTNNKVKDIFIDNKKRIWVGADGGALNLLNRRNNTFTRIKRDYVREKGFKGFSTISIYQTKDGTLWFGTRKGVNRYATKKIFGEKYEINTNRNALPNNTVNTICKINNNKLALGLNNQNFSIYDVKNKHFENHKLPDVTLASTKIKAIAKENEKIIWIFLYDNEAIRYNLKNKTHKLLRLNDSLNISQLLFNKSKNIGNNIYIVSSAGLLKYDLKINELQIFQENKSDDIITDFIVAQNKSFIWVLKNNGNLIQQNIHNDNIQIINLEEKLNKKINTTTFCYSNGKLFIASKNNGLIIYNIQSNEAEVFPFLSRNYEIKTILATDNFIWFSTNYTISRFNLKTKEYSHTDARLLFDNTHYNYNAGLLIDDTTIAMGGKLGLNIFTEGEIIHNKTKYNIITSDIKLYNQSLFYRNDKQLDTLPYYSDEITFHYNQKIFSIEFSLLSFNDPQEIKYAYLLEGLTDKWAYLGKNNKATFSHLPPGKYNLVVKGKDPYGYWHKNKALKINIPPPFWMESWFIITSVCFIILILGFSFYLRGRKTRQLNKKLQRMVKERTSEILEKNEELSVQNEKIEEQKVELEKLNLTKDRLFSIIAHDLKNPFNAISGFAALLLNNYDDYSDQQKTELIRMIQTSSHNAYEMLQNLLHWSRANLNVISFNPKIINIKEIVDENLKFFNIIAKEKKITLSAETKDVKAYADKDLINTVIRNLIANALKFTKKNGKITIEYENDDNSVIIRVIDTGIGIPQESQDKLFYMDNKYSTEGTEGEKGTGIGLVLCKEFTEKNNGTIELQSKVGEGTTFIVKLPKSGDN